jgi:HEPN domain-containing protein
MATDFTNLDSVLATVCGLLEADELHEAVSLLKSAEVRMEATGYDNWNGGTNLYTLYLSVDPLTFARLGAKREEVQTQITDRMKPVIDSFSADWVSVEIQPRLQSGKNWRNPEQSISQVSRKDISDYFAVSGISWWGALNEVDFLNRLYDLSRIKSYDNRYKNAAGDIFQHRINNDDWDNDWVFSDERFQISTSDEKFLRFLAETVHPVVRRNPDEASALVRELNKYLAADGWELAESERISGRPCYAAQRIHSGVVRAVHRARAVADVLDADWMRGEIARLERAVEMDPSLAIGTAKELVETCCKTILSRRGKDVPKGIDLPKLVKETAAELQLVPDGISQEAKGADSIKLVLRSLSTITQGLAELRSLYGTGHGRDGRYRGLSPRHARLAVASAVAFIDFVAETYREREFKAESK